MPDYTHQETDRPEEYEPLQVAQSGTVWMPRGGVSKMQQAQQIEHDMDHPVYPMLGRYVCVHSAPSAWYGFLMYARDNGGVVSCVLADAGLWTQGLTDNLILPGQAGEKIKSRRLGLVTVAVVTAIQPSGSHGEVRLRSTPPNHFHLPSSYTPILESVAMSLDTHREGLFRMALEAYGQPKTGVGNEDAVVRLVTDGVEESLCLPRRVIASVVLDCARQRVW